MKVNQPKNVISELKVNNLKEVNFNGEILSFALGDPLYNNGGLWHALGLNQDKTYRYSGLYDRENRILYNITKCDLDWNKIKIIYK